MNGARIKQERVRRGLSQRELASAVGISQPALKKIESGQTVRSRYTVELEKYLGLMGVEGGQASRTESQPAMQGFTFPVFGSKELAEGDFALTEKPVLNQQPMILAVPEAFGFFYRGDGMSPRFCEGDILMVNRYQPARPGDGILLTHADGGRYKVKQLIQATHTHWIVKTLNPDKQAKLAREEWPTCDLIFAVYIRP